MVAATRSRSGTYIRRRRWRSEAGGLTRRSTTDADADADADPASSRVGGSTGGCFAWSLIGGAAKAFVGSIGGDRISLDLQGAAVGPAGSP
jgi:hypothetical protein